jgi:hypothetical protein
MFFSTSTPQTLWDALHPSPILPGAIWPHIVPGVFFAVTVAKKNGTTGMVNVKTADGRKAK